MVYDPNSHEHVILLGQSLAGSIIESIEHVLQHHPRSSHVLMVALTHAAVRAEVRNRIPGVATTAEHRKEFHDILDATLDLEERRALALK
jgi:hypothetical protein